MGSKHLDKAIDNGGRDINAGVPEVLEQVKQPCANHAEQTVTFLRDSVIDVHAEAAWTLQELENSNVPFHAGQPGS